MSIVNMKRISAIGLATYKEDVLSRLMDLGVVQIVEMKKETEEELISSAPVALVADDDISVLENSISDVGLAIETLDKYSPEKPPLFITRRAMKNGDFEDVMSSREAITGNVRGVLQLREKLHRLSEARNRHVNELSAVRPWIVMDMPLNVEYTKYTDIEFGTVPSTIDMEILIDRLTKVNENVYISQVNKDKDFIYLAVVTFKDATEDIMNGLKQSGFSPVTFRDFEGTPREKQEAAERAIAEKQREIRKVEAMIAGRYTEKKDMECLYDELVMKRDHEAIKSSLLSTKKTFGFDGWVPEKCLKSVEKVLDEHNCYYASRDPEEGEEVPVLLQNGGFSYPFEAVTEMYSLPDYRGVDPTGYFSFFYAIFFGMMLSDAGYGLVITLATFVILRKFDIEGMTKKMIKMFFYCGISTVFWGALFGGWFGDFVHVAGKVIFKADVSIPPIWFDPIKDPTKMLVFALALGIIHIFLGMAISAHMLIKQGKWVDVICDIISWYMVILGGIMWLAGGQISVSVTLAGKIVTCIGAAILLLTGGRNNKGIGKVFGGFGALYNVTGYASDILSYSRLLALGLATGVIAQVVNTIGGLAGSGILGTIVLIVTFIIGHTFNMGINALGAFVHTSRLQYIEFFGKFYEDGGEEFTPFQKNTKYVRITQDITEVKKND